MSTLPDLSQRLGPLPLWGWAGAAAAGISAGVYLRRGRTSSTAGKSAASGAGEYIPVVAGTASTGTGGVGTVALSGGNQAAPTLTGYEDNTAWRKAALSALIANGYGPLEADIALSNYLEGRQPTPDQKAAIDFSLGTVGLPPNPPTIIPAEAPPPPDTSGGGDAPTLPASPWPTDQQSQIVVNAFRDSLGRDPDPGGFEYWRSQLTTGAVTESDLRYYLSHSQEATNSLGLRAAN